MAPETDAHHRLRRPATIALLSLAGGFLLGWLALTTYDRLRPPPPFHGTAFQQTTPAADFTLTGPAGPVRLSDFQGQIVLLFFGYTNCPDVCPTTLATLAQVQAALGEAADGVQLLMIAVDPANDSPAALNDYVQRFDPAFIGLSGSEAALQPVYDQFGIYRQAQTLANGRSLIDHTATVLVLDAAGRLRLAYPFNTPASAIRADLSRLLTERP